MLNIFVDFCILVCLSRLFPCDIVSNFFFEFWLPWFNSNSKTLLICFKLSVNWMPCYSNAVGGALEL